MRIETENRCDVLLSCQLMCVFEATNKHQIRNESCIWQQFIEKNVWQDLSATTGYDFCGKFWEQCVSIRDGMCEISTFDQGTCTEQKNSNIHTVCKCVYICKLKYIYICLHIACQNCMIPGCPNESLLIVLSMEPHCCSLWGVDAFYTHLSHKPCPNEDALPSGLDISTHRFPVHVKY